MAYPLLGLGGISGFGGESAAQGKFRRYREPGKWFSASWAAGSLQGLENAVLRLLHRLFKTLWNQGNRHSKVAYY